MGGVLTVAVRPARAEDALDVWQGRNDPAARAASFDTHEVPLEVHRAWFRRALDDRDRCLLIVEEDGVAAGVVRFDRGDDAWEVSINMAPERRGRGLGIDALQRAARWLTVHEGAARIRAQVRTENDASLRTFASAGYVEERRDEGRVVLVCDLA